MHFKKVLTYKKNLTYLTPKKYCRTFVIQMHPYLGSPQTVAPHRIETSKKSTMPSKYPYFPSVTNQISHHSQNDKLKTDLTKKN
jgi:hypothetical protein